MKEEYTGQQDLRGHDVNETINKVPTPKTLPEQPGDQCSVNSESDVCNSTDILQRIRRLLNQDDVHFVEIEHEPTRTSEDSARARGEPLHVGAKALVLKIDGEFRLLVRAKHNVEGARDGWTGGRGTKYKAYLLWTLHSSRKTIC